MKHKAHGHTHTYTHGLTPPFRMNNAAQVHLEQVFAPTTCPSCTLRGAQKTEPSLWPVTAEVCVCRAMYQWDKRRRVSCCAAKTEMVMLMLTCGENEPEVDIEQTPLHGVAWCVTSNLEATRAQRRVSDSGGDAIPQTGV